MSIQSEALDLFKKAAAASSPQLKGKLYLSSTGWLMLQVPNSLGRGIFDAMNEPGIELPVSDTTEQYNAHISVMRPEEIAEIGGPNRITERGHEFSYSLGKMKDFNPTGWPEMTRCWVVEVRSPELEKLRKSYGLSAIPNEGKYKFHITVAVRRAKVLGDNEVAKASEKHNPVEKPDGITLTDKPGTHLLKAGGSHEHDQGADGTGGEAQSFCVHRAATGLPPNPAEKVGGSGLRPVPGDAATHHAADHGGTATTGAAQAGAGGSEKRAESPDLSSVFRRHVGPFANSDVAGDLVKYAKVTPAQAIARAARRAVAPKSEAQAEAGNYRKGHASLHGLRVAIENPRGSTRSGVGPTGKKWETTMSHHYGYINRTEGLDGDHVDIFIGPHPEAELVYVVDQVDPSTKKFDEHKCMLGFLTLDEARKGYMDNYEKNWKGLGAITPVTMQQFREWLSEGSQRRPIESQTFKMKKKAGDDASVLVLQKDTTRFIFPEGGTDAQTRADNSDGGEQ